MEKTAEQETAKTFQRTRMVVMAAAFAALACVATMVVKVPSPTGGYMNLGDTVVLLGGYLLGPAWGALAGSIGPALADVLLGSPIYAPATLVIKAGMAALAAACHQAFGKGRGPLGLRPAALWESCPWWWATGCTTPCCWGARLVPRRVSQQSGAGCLRHRRLHAAGGGSGPQRLRPAGVPPAVIPATWKKAPPAGLWPAGGALRLRENLKDACGGGPLARRRTPGRRPDGAEPPGPARRRGLLKERPPAGSKTRRGLVGLNGALRSLPSRCQSCRDPWGPRPLPRRKCAWRCQNSQAPCTGRPVGKQRHQQRPDTAQHHLQSYGHGQGDGIDLVGFAK